MVPESDGGGGGRPGCSSRELARNTFASGINRELASDYQSFVAELGLLPPWRANPPVTRSTRPPGSGSARWSTAALRCSTPRCDRRGKVTATRAGAAARASGVQSLASLLALGEALFGRLGWWPRSRDRMRPVLSSARCTRCSGRSPAGRAVGPWRFPGRRDDPAADERPPRSGDLVPVRRRAARLPRASPPTRMPTRFRSRCVMAASTCLPTRVPTVITAIPPGVLTSGQRSRTTRWRSPAGASRSSAVRSCGSGTRTPGKSRMSGTRSNGRPSIGYPHCSRRSTGVCPARPCRPGIDIVDEIDGGQHEIKLAFHFGPQVEVELSQHSATLSWPAAQAPGSARIDLPTSLEWALHKGEEDQILGWYSEGLGRRIPAFALVGTGVSAADLPLCTRLQFVDASKTRSSGSGLLAVSWLTTDAVWHSAR